MKRDIDTINEAYNKVRKQSQLTEGRKDGNFDDRETAQWRRFNDEFDEGDDEMKQTEETIAEEIEKQYADMDEGMWSRVCEILYNRAAMR